jgi:hypothetical protein
MLEFMSEIGEVIYCRALDASLGPSRNVVILDPMWMAELFRAVLFRVDLFGPLPPPRPKAVPHQARWGGRWHTSSMTLAASCLKLLTRV